MVQGNSVYGMETWRLFRHRTASRGPDSIKFPIFSLRNRERAAETGALPTACTAILEHKCERRSPPSLRHLKPSAPAAGSARNFNWRKLSD